MSAPMVNGDATDTVWEAFRDTIRTLYLVQDHSLEKVRNKMMQNHQFTATKAMFEAHFKKWGFRKNLTKEQWRAIAHKTGKRKRDNLESEVCNYGLPMKVKTVNKAISRYGSTSAMLFQAPSPRTPEGITIRTPVAASATLATGRASPAPVYFTPLPANCAPALMSSLPFMQFKAKVNIEENPHASSPGGDGLTSVANRQDFQASVVDYFKEGADREDLSKSLSQNLKALVPESMFPSHSANLQMTAPQHHHSSIAADFLSLTLFMVSNNFIGQDSDISRKLYNWIKRHSDAGLLKYLLSIGGPTAEALAEHLFPLAIEADDARMAKKLLDCNLDPNELRCSRPYRSKITPLEYACDLRSLELVRMLLEFGADANSSSPDNSSPLTRAITRFDQDNGIREHVDIELVQVLLRAGAIVNPAPDESPLKEAAEAWHVELVTVLLSAGGDPNFSDAYGVTPLIGALAEPGEGEYLISEIISVVRQLLQAGADVHATSEFESDLEYSEVLTVLEHALELSSVDLIQVLLDGGAHINESTLIKAVNWGDLDIIKLFLSSGARVTQNVFEDAACDVGSVIYWLLLDSADEGLKETGRGEVMAAAIRQGNKDLINTLSASGVKLRSSPRLAAAIEGAADRGDISVLRLLLKDDSTYRACAMKSLGHSLCFAIAEGRSDVTELLLGAGANVNSTDPIENRTPLLEAILQEDADLSQRLLSAGAAVNTRKGANLFDRLSPSYEYVNSAIVLQYGSSVLPAAVAWGYYPLIRDIIGAGAEINATDSDFGNTALTVAVERGDSVTIQFLIDMGADVNASAAKLHGYTALVAAVRNYDIKMVRYLLDLGADPDEQSLIAAVHKTIELVQTLLTARLIRYQRLSRGFGTRALQYAIALSNAAMINVLLSNGVDPNTIVAIRFDEKKSPVFSLVEGYESAFGAAIRLDRSKDLWMIQMLLRGGADPNKIVCETPENTALLAAINWKSLGGVKTLIAAGADVNLKLVGSISRTPLQLAVEQGDMGITDILLERGADVNAPPCDQYGATSLQFAAIKGYLGLAFVLLEKGADIDASPAKVGGRTALEGASEHGRIDMLQLLLHAGAQVIWPGSEQYQRARQFASENGHIAARRLLETFHAQQLDGLVASDPLAMDVDEVIEDLEFEDWTNTGQDTVDLMPAFA